jgi:hypothetical protein
MHLLFFIVSMAAVWGTLAANAQLREMLLSGESGAGIIVLVPTIMWAFVILFHVASLYTETRTGEKAMRAALLKREVVDDILRQVQTNKDTLEKPKRRAPENQHLRLSDDGELIDVDDEQAEDYGTRANHAGSSS